jgi:hypothetical protein
MLKTKKQKLSSLYIEVRTFSFYLRLEIEESLLFSFTLESLLFSIDGRVISLTERIGTKIIYQNKKGT